MKTLTFCSLFLKNQTFIIIILIFTFKKVRLYKNPHYIKQWGMNGMIVLTESSAFSILFMQIFAPLVLESHDNNAKVNDQISYPIFE